MAETRPMLTLPRWMFDQVGDRFLVAIEPNGTAHSDGGHSDPQDVAKARELFQRLVIIRPPEGTRYVMVTIEEVPPFTGRLNEEAVAWNNHVAREAR